MEEEPLPDIELNLDQTVKLESEAVILITLYDTPLNNGSPKLGAMINLRYGTNYGAGHHHIKELESWKHT